MFEVNTEDLLTCLTEDLKADLVPMVSSSPGMGKSAIVKLLAKTFNLELIDLRVSQCEPVDMQGYPDVVDGRMTFQIPEYFPIEGDPIPEGKEGWLIFLDEFNSGSKQTEAACYKIIFDKAVYKHKLHPKCRIIAAGNLSTDRAIVNIASTATTSRLIHYTLMVDNAAWLTWAMNNEIDHRILAFIKFRPDLLYKFDPTVADTTFPCNRTWEFASKIIKDKKEIDRLTTVRLVGALGDGAATEFSVFSKIYKSLPTIEEILEDPINGWKVPTEASEQYAVSTMLSQYITLDNIKVIIQAIEQLPLEFQVITFKDIYKKHGEFKNHPSIQAWISKHSAEMF